MMKVGVCSEAQEEKHKIYTMGKCGRSVTHRSWGYNTKNILIFKFNIRGLYMDGRTYVRSL